MDKFKTAFSRQIHQGKALECFGFCENAEGGVVLMRWVQTPYSEHATPPQMFDISADEWHALSDGVAAHEREECAKLAGNADDVGTCDEYPFCKVIEETQDSIANAIRARGKA